MDPFSSSPAQPHSVMSSLFGGGQTPASALAHGFGCQTPASALAHGFGGQTPASALAHGFGGQTPASGLGGPGSVFFNHGSLLSGAGPGSILGGPGSILNSSNGPNSIGPNSSILSGFDRAGIEGLNSVHYSEPGSVLNNNLAVPMTPLAGGESSVQNNMPASNIPMMMPATPMTNINAVDVPSPTLQNIVSTVNLGVQLDLKQIALRARNAEYNPKRFAVQKLGFNAKFTEFKVQNMVGSCDVKFPIQLEGLCITHAQFSTYEPELFPGLIYRMVKMSMKMSAMQEALSEHLSQLHGEDKIINFAKECFQIFVGANFCGVTGAIQTALPPTLQPEGYMDLAIQELSFGANKPAPVIRCSDFLWVAKEIFFPEGSYLKSINFEQDLWRLRVHQIWAAVLEEKSLELKKIIDFTLEQLEPLLKAECAAIPPPLVVQYHLEKAACELEYFERSKAQLSLKKAAEVAGIKLELDGALGKRTHFQCKSVAQLALSTTPINVSAANGSSPMSDQQGTDRSDVPLNCKNTDDTLLDSVNFDNNHLVEASTSLSDEQLACILAIGIFESKSMHSSADGVDAEVPLVYINKVIEQKKNWAIQTRAFIERSSLEKRNSRKVERACSQMELIVKLLDGIDDKEALVIYESLHMWESVVDCYKMLKQQEKAEQLVRDLLNKNECEKYYCILGDITSNPEYYLKAIQISGDRSAQASASIGRLLMSQKHYLRATGYFKRSVELQPFQIGRWFNLGYCAMKEDDYNEAVRAYHRCVSFEPEHFEAWNNLAACYVKLNQKERAQKVLMECLKLSYENINVWENFMLVSVDIGDIHQALTAISKMLDLDSKKLIDQLALEVIARMVLGRNKEGVVHWRKWLAEILSRVSSRQSLNYKVMRLYAELKEPSLETTDSGAWSSYTQLLEKAFQRTSTDLAAKTVEENVESLENAIELVSTLRNSWKRMNTGDLQILSQMRLRIRPILSAFDKKYGTACCDVDNEKLKDGYSRALLMIENL